MKLSAAKVKAIREPGRYGDGGGLYLIVRSTGTKSWMIRIVVDGRRRDIGLGAYPAVSLARARERAAANRAAVANGHDPIADKRKPIVPTFREAAQAFYELHLPNLKNGKHRTNWLQVLERHAMPALGDMSVDRIDRTHVLAVVSPIWTTYPPTARRVRQRIRRIMSYCIAHGHVDINPAGEQIDGALPSQPRSRNHFRAMDYREVGEALNTIDASTASMSAKLCIRFLVLTAARSGEARGSLWTEIDGETWTIPASRMKAGVPHRVPLSTQALDVLGKAYCLRDNSGRMFPSLQAKDHPMSDMTLTEVLRRTGLAERATVHGFRTSFKTWTMEQTDTPWAVGEAALAHTLGSSTEQAYARSDLFERRRAVMQQWANYIGK